MFTQPAEPPVSLAIAPQPTVELTTSVEQQIADNIFAETKMGKNLDVTSIITKRLNAMRKLQDNPLDSEAIKLMYKTQKDVRLNIFIQKIYHS